MSEAGINFWIVYGIAFALCTLFMPTAHKISNNRNYIYGDDRVFCVVMSLIPIINVLFGLGSVAMCVGKLLEYIYSSNKNPFEN